MRKVHVECKPDELLVVKLGFPNKSVVHHSSKSRVYAELVKGNNLIAMVDEDPEVKQSKHKYEKELKLQKEVGGVMLFYDKQRNNTVIMLKVKLEDWLISVCKTAGVDHTSNTYNLPKSPNNLHKEIIQKSKSYERLLDHLYSSNNPTLLQLQKWLKGE